MNKDKGNKTFSLTNFYTSCFLYCKGVRLLDINKSLPSRAEFIFKDDGNVESLIRDFDFAEKNSPEVVVDAREFVMAIKSLKDKLYQKSEVTGGGES